MLHFCFVSLELGNFPLDALLDVLVEQALPTLVGYGRFARVGELLNQVGRKLYEP